MSERNSDDVFAVFCSDYARDILVAAHKEPRSADALAEHCGASLPTIYRRVITLVEHNLLEENLQIDPQGNHYKRYTSNLDYVRFEMDESGFAVSVHFERDFIDRFGEFWGTLGPPDNADTDET